MVNGEAEEREEAATASNTETPQGYAFTMLLLKWSTAQYRKVFAYFDFSLLENNDK